MIGTKTKLGRPQTKRLEVKAEVQRLIQRRNLWGLRLLNDRDLARELRISRTTLHAALGEMQADGWLTRRQGQGTFVTEAPAIPRRKTARLAVLASSHYEEAPGWHYLGEMIRGAQGLAPRLRATCEVLALDGAQDAARAWDRREMRAFDAFLLISLIPLTAELDFVSYLLSLRNRPVVLCDDAVRELPVVSVVDGSFQGMRTVTRYVLNLGHRRVAYLHDAFGFNTEKFPGYLAALREHGLRADDELVWSPESPLATQELPAFVDRALERLLRLADPPTALVASSDSWALCALAALERRGLRVGRDFCLASHGDAAIRRGECDGLTRCRIYPRRMGEEAVRAALQGGAP